MTAYYNENDPYAAQWLRNLIEAGHIAPGDVDDRSIKDVQPDDIRGYSQCHFFAGIGVWSLALRWAGWDDARPVWTGSCPCQPFSTAGKRKGKADERHLWPEWFRLIRACRPDTIFGEQVASGDGLGWLDTVQDDLEGEDYASGAVDLCAAGLGAPHIRQRLYFVAYAERRSAERRGYDLAGASRDSESEGTERQRVRADAWPSGAVGDLADTKCDSAGAGRSTIESAEGVGAETAGAPIESGRRRVLSLLGNPGTARLVLGPLATDGSRPVRIEGPPAAEASPWNNVIWLPCSDGKARPTKPGIFPLAHGHSGRMVVRRARIEAGAEVQETHWYRRSGALRAIGNAIIPQVAAAFIRAAMELNDD